MTKEYTIQGKKFTLALPTPKRISAFLDLYGKKKLSDLFREDPENTKELEKIELDFRGDVDSSRKLLEICVAEPIDSIDPSDLDVRVIAGIHTDFFSQLAEKLQEPQT